jgi:hypothetical protein
VEPVPAEIEAMSRPRIIRISAALGLFGLSVEIVRRTLVHRVGAYEAINLADRRHKLNQTTIAGR